MVKSYIAPQIGCVRLRDVTKHDIQVMLNSVSSAGHIRTAEQLRETIKQVIAGAQDAGLLVSCNTAGLATPKRTVTEKCELSDTDIQAILNAEMGLKKKLYRIAIIHRLAPGRGSGVNCGGYLGCCDGH